MKYLKYISIILLLTLCITQPRAQTTEGEKKTPDLTFTVKKLSDGGFELKSRLSLFENRIDFPIEGAKVNYTIGADSLINIDGNLTDKNGYAIAYIKPGARINRDKDGVITAIAIFEGNDKYEAASAEAIFTETVFNLTCELVDTIKTVKISAYKINADGSREPLSGEMITVSVQRMFSKLPIGDANLDEEGTGSVEFPNDLPGDSLGNLQVVAFIEDHEIYGNAEASTIVQWGIPKQKVLVTHRALWTEIAPLWMIISLTILLIGVWAHYIYVFGQLIIIKLKGKTQIQNNS